VGVDPEISFPLPKAISGAHREQIPRRDAGRAAQPSRVQSKVQDLSDPDRVLARLDSFITAYGARAILFETWTSNPQLFELLLLLFDRSEFLAEMAIRTPDLIDDLVLSGRLGRHKNTAQILTELRHGRDDADQRLWLRRYHHAEFMRIGLRDILGLADYEQNFIELTALADACLQYALEVIVRRHKLKRSPFAIIGLGKLGGRELNYGSDLDILFVSDSKSQPDLPRLQKLATEFIDLLSSQTELGIAFVIDTRLRPDGEKGLLVNTLEAHGEYYRQRGQLWEIQALTRTRPVAGEPQLGERFQELTARLTNFRGANESAASNLPPLACFTPAWKREIARIRERIEKERTPPGQDALAFKTGSGGLIDAEFIAQAFCLERGWQEANTLRALERIREEGALPRPEAARLLDSYRNLRRVESILRRWSFEGEAVLPFDPAPYYASVSVRLSKPEAFREAVAAYRRDLRRSIRKCSRPRRRVILRGDEATRSFGGAALLLRVARLLHEQSSTRSRNPGPTDSAGRPLIRKRGTIDLDMVETTPIGGEASCGVSNGPQGTAAVLAE
jgi:glutamate-ammonia-ligase adenylyltransferase